MGRGGELDSRNTKRPRSPMQKIEGVLKFTVRVISQLLDYRTFGGALRLISALDATRPFPERKWSLPSNSRQGFLTPGSSAPPPGLPNLQLRSVTILMEATQSPVHSGGNRAGFTPASLVTLYGHL
jgi:hypothetical protein